MSAPDMSNGAMNHDETPFSLDDAFFDTLRSSGGEMYVCKYVSADMAEKFFEKRDARGQKLRLFYHPTRHELIIKAPGKQHETSKSLLDFTIRQRITDMVGLGGWLPSDAATFGAQLATTGKGEGDASGHPSHCPDRAWPTLVLEAAWSQSTACVRQKMQWWFALSEHAVQVVLVLLVDRERRHITIEKYTGASGAVPVLRQAITMAPAGGDERAQAIDVTGAPLVLEFALLFLRMPLAEKGEQDVVVGVQELEVIARSVFSMR